MVAVVAVVAVAVVDDVVVVVVELAVTSEDSEISTTKSCDLLRVGSNDFHFFKFQSRSSPPSTNHMTCG